MAPPVVAGFSKKVPVGGDVISGKALPAGTEVHMNVMALMRDQDVFGDDVEIFRPERFIECDEAASVKRRKVMDLNFGHGRWLCLGRVMALIEINKILVEVSTIIVPPIDIIGAITLGIVQLLRSFDFQVRDPENPWRRESTLSFFIKDFFARVTVDTTF